jgi:murein L,D-transpeptidase YcbB/YkuD
MKNTKTVLGIIAFIATFIFSAGLMQILFPTQFVPTQFERPQDLSSTAFEIESFIQSDIRNGKMRDQKLRSQDYSEMKSDSENYSIFYAETMREYWSDSSKLDARDFPRDFQVAWKNHMQAWQDYADFLADTKENQNRNVMSEAEFRAADDRYNNEINRTWYKVLRIGRTYGAEVF